MVARRRKESAGDARSPRFFYLAPPTFDNGGAPNFTLENGKAGVVT